MSPVAVLFRRMGPYHVGRVSAAARRFPTVAVELTSVDRVYAWQATESPGLRRVTIFPDEDAHTAPRKELDRRVARTLDEIGPGAVAIPGWSTPFALAALRWCGRNGASAIVMSESQASDARRSWISEAPKQRVVSLFSSALVGGTRHAAYLRALGMPQERIFFGYDVVDNAHFANGAERARADAASLRRKLDLPEYFFLVSSRFVEKKNLLRLLDAFGRYRELAKGSGWKLALLGDGPLKPAIQERADQLNLGESLVMPGFVQYAQLPAYYGLASVFIHPSIAEQWGLVVNEAMAAGLPVLVSKACGCAADLLRDGENGYTFDPLNTDELAGLMVRLAADRELRGRMSEASRRNIFEWPVERFGEGLEAAARAAIPRRPGLADVALLRLLLMRPTPILPARTSHT